jgi:hypothetical protein
VSAIPKTAAEQRLAVGQWRAAAATVDLRARAVRRKGGGLRPPESGRDILVFAPTVEMVVKTYTWNHLLDASVSRLRDTKTAKALRAEILAVVNRLRAHPILAEMEANQQALTRARLGARYREEMHRTLGSWLRSSITENEIRTALKEAVVAEVLCS